MMITLIILQWFGFVVAIYYLLSLTSVAERCWDWLQDQYHNPAPNKRVSPIENLQRWEALDRQVKYLFKHHYILDASHSQKQVLTEIASSVTGINFKNYKEFIVWFQNSSEKLRELCKEAMSSHIVKRMATVHATLNTEWTEMRLEEEISMP